ncbi:acyltransferase family protein [Pseudomonas sp. NyZ704]|nr:acyltransferase family protein [Pseudomonas sp. NyZ704]
MEDYYYFQHRSPASFGVKHKSLTKPNKNIPYQQFIQLAVPAEERMTSQRDDIQGLRAIAVLAVIAFHINSGWLPGGFIGVDIFLVISGYLLTSVVLRKKQSDSFLFIPFYIARIRRIVPAYLSLLAVTSVVMAFILIPKDFVNFKEGLISALYFNSNNYFANHNDYFAPASHELALLHTWSLAVEMQFYLLLPIILVAVPRRYLTCVLSLIAMVLLSHSVYRLAGGNDQATYFSLLARIPEFLVGSLLALSSIGSSWSRQRRNSVSALGLFMITGSFFLITAEQPFPGLLALPACIGVAFIIAARYSLLNDILSNSFLQWIGALSYSLYLWHWPVLASSRYFYESYQLPSHIILAAMILTLLLSYLSYRFIELPFRTKSSGSRQLSKSVVLIGMASAAIGLSMPLNSKLLEPLPIEQTRYADGSTICHGQILASCSRGEVQSKKNILLLGDSHAAQLNHFADTLGNSLDIHIKVITGSSCVPFSGFDVDRLPDWARAPCISQIASVESHLDSADVLLIAGMWQYHALSDDFLKGFDLYLRSTSDRDQPVIVMGQTPMLTSNIHRLRRFNALGSSKNAGMENTWAIANQRINELVSKYPNAKFLDPSSFPLFATPPFANNLLIYSDDHHLNEVGSKAYGEAAIGPIRKILTDIFSESNEI